MGWLGNLLGSADSAVLQNGIRGRGESTGLTMSGMTVQGVSVYLDRVPTCPR